MSTAEFWRLVTESRLIKPEQCQQLGREFSQVNPNGEAQALANWLVGKRAITKYHAMVLMAGRAGPFLYGDYQVFDRLDKGRFSGMFRAVHTPSGYPVLLRFLTGPAVQNPQLWAQSALRAKRLGQLKGPQFQRVFEPVDLQSFKFAVIEELQGASVASQLTRGPLPATEACRIVRLAALGLQSMHSANLLHGDVRPQNIWLEPNGNVRLMTDPFDLPASMQAQQSSAPDQLAARADYMAPEFLNGGKEPDTLTDIYALGCSLYQMLSGKAPFAEGDVHAKMQRHATEAIAPLEALGVPAEIAKFNAYMMAKNPDVRHQQAQVVADQLAQFLQPQQLQPSAPNPHARLAGYEQSLQRKPAAVGAGAPSFAGVGKGSAGGGGPVIVAGDAGRVSSRGKGTAGTEGGGKGKKNQQLMIAGIAGGVGLVLLLLLGAFFLSGDSTPPVAGDPNAPVDPAAPTDPATPGDTPAPTPPPAVPTGPNSQKIVDDDGALLWASPTSGQPISMRYAPLGSQIYLYVRPADLLESPQGPATLQGLGPDFETIRQQWEQGSGFQLSEVKQLLISFHGNPGETPRPAFVVYPKDPTTLQDLQTRWGNPEPQTEGESTFYNARGWSFYPPPRENGTVFSMGSLPEIKDVITLNGGIPGMRREMAELASTTDADRHFTALFAPNYFFSDGRRLLVGPRQRLIDPLKWFLGEGLQAGCFSLHVGTNLYAEMRLIAEGGTDRITLANEF